jgi:hypothetical protein
MLKGRSTLAACIALAMIGGTTFCDAASAADAKKPNIVIIWGDDVGQFQSR